MNISDEEIRIMQHLSDESTPCPWTTTPAQLNGEVGCFAVRDSDGRAIAYAEKEVDAEFIAHAREDVPKLITEIERLREELSRYDKILRGPVDIDATDEYGRVVKFHGFKLNMPDGDTE